MNLDERQNLIGNLLMTLSSREEQILRWYFGIGSEKWSVDKIGENFDIPQRSVRYIKNKGVRRMIYRVTKMDNPTYSELASHIDKDLIDSCIKERGRLYDKFMNQLMDPSEG